ncbi:MAG: ferredoxin-thioredoxin reductase catalytic domain-containing protein [Eubacteriales bacterium]|nr:ferredoxin-thioredoxin reductase catalytic domain-containing protein [Eubacteriales bacterium]MDY4897503.1 ferredoxin-thioredoxin reductase catalytic domain-containing protein [Eubacteriales bacterium]
MSDISNNKKAAGRVRLNENAEVVRIVREGLKRTGGYCPCRREQTEDTKCICREFREQMADPDFEGYCHCMLYYKEKQK